MRGKLGYSRIFAFVFMITLLLCSSYLSGTESSTDSGLARYRVFSLRHISAQRGKAYLAKVGLGTVSQLPGTNTLLVTAQPSELIKASAILKLVDNKKQFVIKAVFPASAAKDLPTNDQIASEVGNISIGTFSNPPADTKQAKAIIDIHNDSIIAVAPAAHLEKIIWAVEQLQKAEYPGFEETTKAELESPERTTPSSELTSRADTADSESDELFSRLLSSLAEAEKTAAESQPAGAEPNEPSRPAAAGSKQAEKMASQPAEQPQGPSLPAVVKGSEAEEPELEPKLERRQPAVEIEQPSEGVEPVSRDPALREPSKVRSYSPEPIANGEEILELNLPEKLTIVDLLGLVGEYLHLDYMYDPVKVTGEVTLKLQGKLRGPIKLKDLYPLLESVLKFKGFVMTRKGNLITIVPAAEVLNIDPVLLDAKKGEIKYGDVIVTRIFKLKHIDTASAKNLLDGMKLGTNIRPIGETKTLIITGYAYRMARIEELLEMIDKPGEPKKFRFRQLRYTMAKTLAPKIKTLAEQLGTISITIAAPAAPAPARPARGRPPARPAPTPAAPAKPTVYLDADERTNRILMIGLEEQLVVVNELIDTLDVEQQDLRTLRLYDIQHVGAEEVVNKLQEFGIIGGQAAAGRATRATRITADSKAARPPTTRTGTTEEALVEDIERWTSIS